MDPATLIALLGAAAISSAGAYYTNQQNIKYAQEANEESISLANTAHQREVRDLRAAGLNPILSAQGSGASTPQLRVPGLTNPVEAVGNNASSLAHAINGLTKAEIQTAQAEASSAQSTAEVASASALPERIDQYARLEAMTGIRETGVDALLHYKGDESLYDNLVQQYKNEIESNRYLSSKEHAIYEDIKSGAGTVIQGINSASGWRRAASAIRRDNYEMSKPSEHESVRQIKHYDSRGQHRGTSVERRRYN